MQRGQSRGGVVRAQAALRPAEKQVFTKQRQRERAQANRELREAERDRVHREALGRNMARKQRMAAVQRNARAKGV